MDTSFEPAVELKAYISSGNNRYNPDGPEFVRYRDNPFAKYIYDQGQDQYYFDSLPNILKLVELVNHNSRKVNPEDFKQFSDRLLEFTKDTIHYLRTGKRRLSLEQWYVLTQSAESYLSKTNRALLLDEVSRDWREHVNDMDIGSYISMWFKHVGGVRDLAYSYLIYTREPITTM